MGGPLSVILRDIHMIEWRLTSWYQSGQCFTNDTWMTYIIAARKIPLIKLYDGLNNYHPKVKLTIETNQLTFLDTEIIHNNGMIEKRVHRKKNQITNTMDI